MTGHIVALNAHNDYVYIYPWYINAIHGRKRRRDESERHFATSPEPTGGRPRWPRAKSMDNYPTPFFLSLSSRFYCFAKQRRETEQFERTGEPESAGYMGIREIACAAKFRPATRARGLFYCRSGAAKKRMNKVVAIETIVEDTRAETISRV